MTTRKNLKTSDGGRQARTQVTKQKKSLFRWMISFEIYDVNKWQESSGAKTTLLYFSTLQLATINSAV